MAPIRVTSADESPLTRRGLATVHDDGRLELRIPRALRSPNELLGHHWRVKAQERGRWQVDIAVAVLEEYGPWVAQRMLSADTFPGGRGGCQARRRVTVVREAPSRRRFIRDDDNLRFAVKPLLDALKHLGLIRDDHRKWLDLPVPTQAVSVDGRFWTAIEIAACQEG